MSIGRWALALHNPSGNLGRPVPGAPPWRWVVEIAAVTTAHAPGSAMPIWNDVTRHVVDVGWRTGDAAAESRGAVGSATIRINAAVWTDVFAGNDPLGTQVGINDRAGAGWLIRYGLLDVSGDWRPLFTGIVDSISEVWSSDQPDDVKVHDVLAGELAGYYLAGYTLPSTHNLVANMTASAAITALVNATDLPAALDLDTSTSSIWYPNTVVGPSDAEAPPLGLLHRLADSAGARVFTRPDGRLAVAGWNVALESSWQILDKNLDVGYGLNPSANIIYPVQAKWMNSMDRLVYRARASSPATFSVPASGASTSPVLSDRFKGRSDRPGWPKNDLLHTSSPPPFDLDAAAYRSREITRADHASFDTRTASRQGGLSRMLSFVVTTSSDLFRTVRVQRRTAGTAGVFDHTCRIAGIRGLIQPDPWRLTVTHSYDWWIP